MVKVCRGESKAATFLSGWDAQVAYALEDLV
jgi:hypothetical protein